MGEILAEIIGEAHFIAEILSAVPQKESDDALFSFLESESIRKLVSSADDLVMVMEWIYDDCDDHFNDIADLDFIKSKIKPGF